MIRQQDGARPCLQTFAIDCTQNSLKHASICVQTAEQRKLNAVSRRNKTIQKKKKTLDDLNFNAQQLKH